MHKVIGYYIDTIFCIADDILSPRFWPTWVRRAYLLTLPVSAPLHLLLWVAEFVLALSALLLLYLPVAAADKAKKFWNGEDR